MKESTTRLKKLNDKLRQEQEYSKYRNQELNTIINKAEQYINDKLNSNENDIQKNENDVDHEINPTDNENDIIGDDQDLKEHNEIITTSSMRSRLKGLETKERVKMLMKRSMSSNVYDVVKHTLDERINEEYQSPVKMGDMSPKKSIKNKLDQLNKMHNPIAKHIDDDAISMKSNRSHRAEDRDRALNKRSNMVKILQDEVNKEKSAKNNALSILKNLSNKSKEVEMAIKQLSN